MSIFCRRVLFGIVITIFGLVSYASAQNSNDRGTPADSKKGQSTQSTYARDKIEAVNLANGNFSLSIPLATIGGRGSASFTIALSYNSKVWSTQSDNNGVSTAEGSYGSPRNIYSAMYDKLEPEDYEPYLSKLGGGWSILTSPGIKLRTFGIDPTTIGCHHTTNEQPDCGFKYALTKMWVTLPDGSQLELRDVATQGAPSLTTVIAGDGYHYLKDRDRGRIWRSIDGSNVIFVRDAGYPVGQIGGQNEFPSGWVFLSDGTRLRMEQGVCSKIIDRNGNFITLASGVYTDQLGRQTILNGSPLGVTVKGYMGTPDRSLTIDSGIIGDLANLRTDFHSLPRPFTTGDAFRDALDNFSDHTIQTPHTDLFIKSEGSPWYGPSGLDVGTKTAVTQLNLLDGRSLRFHYNQYGEVAEIVYPGGGLSQIDYNFQSSGCEIPAPFNVNRGVSQRRTLTNGVDVDATWLYSADAAWIDGVYRPAVDVSAHQGDATGTTLAFERHFFRMLNAEYRQCAGPYTFTGNEKWENAKEFRTETYTGTGTTVTTRDWQQRAAVVWANDVGLSYNTYVNEQAHGQDQPPNDPRVMSEETTLEDGKVKRVEYGYDEFNNVTSTKEYDFGTAGSPGTLLRQTFRTYLTAQNGYCYSNLNPGDSSCGSGLATDVTSIIYQPGLLLSETVKDGSGNQKAYSEFEYDNYTTATNHAALVVNGGMIQYDGSRFSAFPSATQPRGNVTKVTRWLGSGTDVVAFSQYDNAGQVIWSKDPNGNISTVAYADNFGAGDNPDSGSAGPNGATFALASMATNALGHVVKMQYNYSLGGATGAKDANNVITKTEYDNLGRPFKVTAALGLGEQSVSQMSYPTLQENSARVSKQLDTTSGVTRWLTSKTDFDGFDRPKTSWQSEDGQSMSLATFTIRADTIYDAIGRVKQVSNPYRPATETAIYTTTAYDLAGRVISVTTPDSAVVTSSYYANTVTVSDQMQRQRKSVTDALGHLKEVHEVPNDSSYNYLTSYDYDTLDNLTSVSQGTQTRTFAYDSLKRLKSATNPESGTICYGTVVASVCQANGYDANGNLIYKTDARLVQSTYAYDVLNRNTSVTYSNDPAGTPAVHRYYDGLRDGNFTNIPNVKGRLWQTETSGANGSRTTINSFDALGRPLSESQQFYSGSAWSQSFTTQRTYNLGGGVTAQTYPSGHTVAYAYDAAGRTGSFSGNLGDGTSRTYSSETLYSPLGGMTKEKFGTDTAIYNKLFYNSRGQLAEIREGTSYTGPTDTGWERGAIINFYGTCWGMCGGQNSTAAMPENNGNLRRQEIYIPGGPMFAQTFDYDALNRLQRVHEYTGNTALDWQQEYGYDRYGNRTIGIATNQTWGSGINNREFAVETATNRLYAPGDLSLAEASRQMQYDQAGNLKKDVYSGAGATRVYDAENRMTSETQANNVVSGSYTYNADGQRVRRKINGVETWQVYGMDGELLAEYAASAAPASPQKEYGYRNGQLLITADAPASSSVNLALNKPATQSSTYQSAGGSVPQLAVDGNTSGNWLDYSVTATNSDAQAWWRVDLGTMQSVQNVEVWNRTDCCPERLTNFNVILLDASQAVVATVNVAGQAGTPTTVQISGAARYVKVQLVGTNYLSLAEVKVWSATTSNVNWLVSDQLGTPRMIFDKTGALATVKRHDYLPFGEELSAGQGARSNTLGYGAADGVRQKFTQKERDNETGLDYFGARYYGSIQGRFTGADPAPITEKQLVNPQDLNRYAYVANNPLKFIDPDGEEKILVVITTFIPDKSATAAGRTFEGDGRNVGEPGGFRTQQSVTIETDPSRGGEQAGPFNHDTGISQELSGPGGSPIGQSAQASGETLEGRVTRYESGVVNIQAKGNEGNPLVSLAPGITYDFNIKVQSAGTQGNVTVTVTGSHDQFPAYEISVTRPEVSKPTTTTVYSYDPRQAGTNSPYNLIPGHTQTINPPRTTVIAPPPPPPPPERRHGKRGDD
jgi:RHS repeat-associated protein